MLKRDAGDKKGKLLCCKRIFERIKANLAEIQLKKDQNVQKTHFAKSSSSQWVKPYSYSITDVRKQVASTVQTKSHATEPPAPAAAEKSRTMHLELQFGCLMLHDYKNKRTNRSEMFLVDSGDKSLFVRRAKSESEKN